jgi:hypothetical protein
MRRMFSAAVIAAAALTTLGLAAPAAVGAGTSSQAAAAHIGKTYGKGFAGYKMTGNGSRFRYIETTVTVPAATSPPGPATMLLGAAGHAVRMRVRHGGTVQSGYRSRTSYWHDTSLGLAASAGDRVTISIYGQRHMVRFRAVNLTTGATAQTGITSSRPDFTWARVTGSGPRWSFAPTDTRLWKFEDTRLTTTSGRHGTIFGPWATNRVIGTRSSTPAGAVALWPTYPSNNGRNFGIWWRAAS